LKPIGGVGGGGDYAELSTPDAAADLSARGSSIGSENFCIVNKLPRKLPTAI
jgi:hypothetical protein